MSARILPSPYKDDSKVSIKWAVPPSCAYCGDELWLQSNAVEDYPYLHTDMRFLCRTCNKPFLHGIPKRRDAGLALHVMDSNPPATVVTMAGLGTKRCEYDGHGSMLMTKIFGDWVFKDERIEYQWKCPVCFLVRHELHKRKISHGEQDLPLTEEERETLLENLRKMGYID